MAVDITDLVDSLKREVSPPGTNLYPNAVDADWEGQLQDAFWEARLMDMLSDWTLTGNDITPIASGGADMGRDMQQLIVLYAGYRIVLTNLQNLKSSFKAKAGPVEFETQQQATVLKAVLDAIRSRINIVLTTLSGLGVSNSMVLDAVIERSYSIAAGDTWWVNY